MELTDRISKHNFYFLIWHSVFLAFAKNFMDVDTIIPAMLVDAGGSAMQIGIMSAIMLGGSSFTQLVFAPFISNYPFKRKYLLSGINLRIISLLAMGLMLYFSSMINPTFIIWLIFIIISVFSLSGAFANVSYVDILGKSINNNSRKTFFPMRQVLTGIVLFFSAFLAKKILVMYDYPINYAYMFFIAFGLLAIASIGFWNIKEVTPSKMIVKNPKHLISLIRTEIKHNKKLVYYLGFINTMGISMTLLPFVILYAKTNYHTQSADTGMFLVYKVLGGVLIGFLLLILSGKYKYKYLLYGSVVLALFLPLILLLSADVSSLIIIFLLGGIIYTVYSISMNGVLLEVSGTENRTWYAGITGAGNILPAIFPLVAGWVINSFGFEPFFIIYMLIIFSSLFFIYKINCKK